MELQVAIVVSDEDPGEYDALGMAQSAVDGDLNELAQLIRLAAAGHPAVEVVEVTAE